MTNKSASLFKKSLKKERILGIGITGTPKDKLLKVMYRRLKKWTKSGNSEAKFLIVTPNPEHLILSKSDKKFAEILNRADISIPDGHGIVAAYKFLRLPSTKNIILRPFLYLVQGLGVGLSIFFDKKWLEKEMKVVHGRELFLDLVKLADENGWKMFFLGGWNKVAERSKLKLEKKHKEVEIKAATGPVLDESGVPINSREKKTEKNIIKKINDFKPHVLVVGFGAPEQEKWLDRVWEKLKVGSGMVVGGTFNYISGDAKTPPEWVSEIGLEWLWRLFTGSQKPERILSAFPRFSILVYLTKIKKI